MSDKDLMTKNKRGGDTCKHKATILLTGTIDPLSFNRDKSKRNINSNLNNALERLAQYESAISRYITCSDFTDIIFVENSGYLFPIEKYTTLAEEYGKRFEFLYRELTDEQVGIMQTRGKGWGEADLIDYAMCNSKLIAETDVIYKCTGRVFLKNSKQILKTAYKENEFMKWAKYDWCSTVFFKVIKQDYFKYFQSIIDEVNDYEPVEDRWYNKRYIEHCYFMKIKNTEIKTNVFKYYPDLNGVGGSNYGVYDVHWIKRTLYNILPTFLRGKWKIKKKESK